MPIPHLKVYIPRSENEIMTELKNEGLPRELKEQLQLVDAYPKIIKSKLEEIMTRLIDSNKLGDIIRVPKIQISASNVENVVMLSSANESTLIISKKLLENIGCEDELAGVIGHELAQLVLHQKNLASGSKTKTQVAAADNLAVDFLTKAAYDPNGCIYFLEVMGESKSSLVSVEDIDQADLSKTAELLRHITDPRPSASLRIRLMQSHIAAGLRLGNAAIPARTPLEAQYKASLKSISYETPITQALREANYTKLPVIDQLMILTRLLDDAYPPISSVAAQRTNELGDLIANLKVDFNQPEQTEAFKCLADITMGDRHRTGNDEFVWPSGCNSLDERINPALIKAWQQGHKDPKYLGRNEDLKIAVDLFMSANSQEMAEQYASQILNLCNKIGGPSRSRFNIFHIHSSKEIRASIQATGSWHPPYSQHVLFCKQPNSEKTKQVLRAMGLSEDPWAKTILGPEQDEDYIYQLPEKSYEFRLLEHPEQFDRDDQGVFTKGQIEPVEAYPWTYFDDNTPLERLKQYHMLEGKKKQHFEECIISTIDWGLLKSNFQRFIAQYGRLLKHYSSIVPIQSPFAKRFFEELLTILRHADEDFKSQLKHFFHNRRAEYGTKEHPKTVYFFEELFQENTEWRYQHATRPSYWHLNDPWIQFILNPNTSSIVSDWNKLNHLQSTSDFIKPDPTRKLAEIFQVPLRLVLGNYPENIRTIDDLIIAAENISYQPITIALEAERLAHEFKKTMTLQEVVILDQFKSKGDHELYVSNLKSFFDELRHTTAERFLNIDDCFELIKNYRYADAHYLIHDAPSIRSAAHQKMKQLLVLLPERERLECIKELFKPEIFTPWDIIKGQVGKKYDGYIADPDFRNWLIEQLTDLLATQLGQDDGTITYLERAKLSVDDLAQNTAGMTQLNILSQLATKINAQKELAYLMRDTHNNSLAQGALKQHYQGIAIELLINESSKDPQLRQHILEFLSNPLTKDSANTLSSYVMLKYRTKLDKTPKVVIDDQLCNYHKNFRQASLEMKTVYLEPILFPLNSTKEEQIAIIKKNIDTTFSTSPSAPAANNNRYARIIFNAYLDAADLPERRLLATALFITNMHDSNVVERTIGQKLNMLLSNLGPAGGKLLQAIHSHPQTPEDIKKDLASSKTMFAPPLRWELIDCVDESGLLMASDENPNPITSIGKLIGTGSFGLTVFNTLEDGSKTADTFLRRNAARTSDREFNMMENAAKEVLKLHPELQPITGMIAEAKRSAVEETDMKFAHHANFQAEKSYHNVKVIVGDWVFTNQVTTLLKTGNNFKRVSIAPGVHYNDLLPSDYKAAIAKAMVATQLSLRLAGMNTDLDRHGGNIKVQDQAINHFDFGAMNVKPISKEDKIITGKILAATMIDVSMGGSFIKAFLANIEKADVSAASRIYLNGLNKDLLALGDYLNFLTQSELSQIFATCLTAKTVDPQISMAWQEALGPMRFYFAMSALKSTAQKAEVRVFLKVTDEPFEAIRKQMKIAASMRKAAHAIRSAHLEQEPLTELIDQEQLATIITFNPMLNRRLVELEEYGQSLKRHGRECGDKVINLAKTLRSEINNYAERKTDKEEASIRINALMTQGKLIMREDRRVLDILGHIILALTTVGFGFMVFNKIQNGTFFLNKTKRECLLSNIESDLPDFLVPTQSMEVPLL